MRPAKYGSRRPAAVAGEGTRPPGNRTRFWGIVGSDLSHLISLSLSPSRRSHVLPGSAQGRVAIGTQRPNSPRARNHGETSCSPYLLRVLLPCRRLLCGPCPVLHAPCYMQVRVSLFQWVYPPRPDVDGSLPGESPANERRQARWGAKTGRLRETPGASTTQLVLLPPAMSVPRTICGALNTLRVGSAWYLCKVPVIVRTGCHAKPLPTYLILH
ncbi:uncharacterized protein LY79DRAFT_26437 [Colletotrichum navitas]|uniref:Uncharacterized protein n=1 Tax=Colletotrichum navitas TaxID=681940 RepID=A0AAD8VCZ1_9PEZI|nr:uncharacterized protein LY79DRAFT_26437 [Colletotrichum navitas]KAK1600633.1 hypothetical protein LY79DRAFT_26437 [Colletotrichum navitas]